MSTIEFHAKVTNGSIPEEYRSEIKGDVRVILVTEGYAEGLDMIEHLLDHPMKIDGFKAFTREDLHDQR